MNLKTVTIADLEPHPDNPNTHPAKQIDALGDSLDEFDQVKNVVIWRGMMLAGHAVREAAIKSGRLTLDAVDVSHWDEAKAAAFMLADIRLPDMGFYDEAAMVEALRDVEEPLGIPGIDEEFLKGLEGWEVEEPPPDPDPPPVDKAEELQEKWQVKLGDIWQIKSATQPGHYHRLICGDCRDMATVEALTEGCKVNGIFTSPPYAMQRAKQYGGVEADKYVDWWEAVQENVRAVLVEDGSFFVNIKPHCKDGQRVLYAFDLVLAMVRRWGWWFVDELCWTHQGIMGKWSNRFKNQFEPVYHFSTNKDIKLKHSNVIKDFEDQTKLRGGYSVYDGLNNRPALTGSPFKQGDKRSAVYDGALPGNRIKASLQHQEGAYQAAIFPLKLPTFFIKAYSDETDIWLDPFCGSGTVLCACENEKRIGFGIEKLEKYCGVILERLQTHIGNQPHLITNIHPELTK